jgi:uncharacterized protein
MTPLPGSVVQTAEFVGRGLEARFRLVSTPASRPLRGTVIFVPAFAEEMNKSRRMAARMAQGLAAQGWRVVQKDSFGTGDSAGEFGDASWEAWLADVAVELEAAQAARVGPVWLWCHRAGALLGAALLPAFANVNMLLWQPVLSGALHLQQFLRLYAGARIVGLGQGSGASPLHTLRAGQAVEVGGYVLSPALAAGLEQAKFEVPPGFTGQLVWFDLSNDDVAPGELPAVSLQTTNAVLRLQTQGVSVVPQVLRGAPFWQTLEIEECELLLQRSLEALQ